MLKPRRREDVRLLFAWFFERYAEQHRTRRRSIEEAVFDRLSRAGAAEPQVMLC